jgi:hypothetical protein
MSITCHSRTTQLWVRCLPGPQHQDCTDAKLVKALLVMPPILTPSAYFDGEKNGRACVDEVTRLTASPDSLSSAAGAAY